MARASTKRRFNVNNLSVLAHELRPAVAKNKTKAERLIVQIQKRQARIAEDFYQIGVALKALSGPAVYQAAGHKSFKELLGARRLVKTTTAYKLIAVVDHYSKLQAQQLGLEKAYALTRFVAATPAADLAAVLVRENPLIGRIPLDRISVRDLNLATARVRRAATKPTADPEAKAARRTARALQRTLRAAGAGSAKVRAVRLEGEWHVRTDMKVADAEGWGP
ncbi:MAG: hypothetical protein JRH11_02690 [Deltaproteobacteria bacterium]|nr:hypothetical protein [Deltaproteobacteria bacterium]